MFRKEVTVINTIVTSREAILKGCRDMVSETGLSTVNMRSVAKRCGVALGSLYNYFPSKDALILATIESVWEDIFHMETSCKTALPFVEYVNWIFESVRRGAGEYPNFFTAHSLSFASGEKDKARNTMEHYFSHMKLGMMEALHSDPAVRKDAFSGSFSESDFLDFVLMNLLTRLMQKKSDCALLLELIRRAIYKA
ncbi:MAG: TetR/AcrR family transcriptional regulator [Lachnospiraceae bacterium]|jgi:AcrR family transcriptional regulator